MIAIHFNEAIAVDFIGQQDGKDVEGDSSSEDFEGEEENIGKESQQTDDIDSVSDDLNITEKEDVPAEIDFNKEADIARKVLNNLITPSVKGTLPSPVDDSMLPKGNEELNSDETVGAANNLLNESGKVSGVTEPGNSSKSMASNLKQTEGEEDLQRTIFINNLPFDINNEEVKQRFSGFGEVQSFFPVLHHVTKYVFFLRYASELPICHCSSVLISLYLWQAPKRNWFSQVQNDRCSYCCSYSCKCSIWFGNFFKR